MDPTLFPFLQQLFGGGGGGMPVMPPDAIPSPEMAQPMQPPQAPPNPMAPSLGELLGASAAGAGYQPPGQTAASAGGNAANAPVPLPASRPEAAGASAFMPPGGGLPGLPPGGGSPPGLPSGGPPPMVPPGPPVGPPLSLAPPNPGAGVGAPPRPPGPGVTPGSLQQMLQGVKAMAPPQAQTIHTPPPPRPQPVQQAQIINLLSSLGIGPQHAMGMGLFRR
jgi:hypothetical protein